MSRRDRRQAFAPSALDLPPRAVHGFAPPPPSHDEGAPADVLPESVHAVDAGDVQSADDPSPAPEAPHVEPVARYSARRLILHNGRRFDAHSHIPAEDALAMIAGGLRIGEELVEG